MTFATIGGASYTIARSGGNSASYLMLANSGSAVPITIVSGGQTIAAPLVLAGSLNVTAWPGTVLTIAGSISQTNGSQSLSVSGGGGVILSGTSSYSGGTTISGAVLAIAAPSALPSSGLVTIGSGGRLVLGGGAGSGRCITASSPATSSEVALSAATQTTAAIAAGIENMATLGDASATALARAVSGGDSAAAVPEPSAFVFSPPPGQGLPVGRGGGGAFGQGRPPSLQCSFMTLSSGPVFTSVFR